MIGLWLAGCGPQAQIRSADRQVSGILRQQQERTLGYEPETEVSAEIPSRPTAESYSRSPATPAQPAVDPPLEPSPGLAPYGPLGPEVGVHRETRSAADGPDLVNRAADYRRTRGLEYGPPLTLERPTQFDLMLSLEYAVQNSRAYHDRMEDLYLSALSVTLERHLCGPRPFVRTGLQASGEGRDADYRAALSATATAGVRQRLPHGGEVVAQTLVEFVSALRGNVADGETATLALSGSLPLLRGAGMVNLEPLIASERQLVYQVRTFEEFRQGFLVDVASRYFGLLRQLQGLENRRRNYENLVDLTERARALFDAERVIFLEVQRALQAQLIAENRLIEAEEAYQSAVDSFKILIGMPVEQELEIIPVDLEVAIPVVDVLEAVEMAMRYRLDLRTAEDQIEDARRGVQIAQNRLLPELNLSGDARIRNPAGTSVTEINERTLSYTAGLTLDLPIDQLAERNAYRRALISYHRAHRNVEELRDRIAIGARDALRAIRSAEVTLEIQRAGIELAQQRLEFANERMRLGQQVDTRDVVEAQTSLLDAQDEFEAARAQLQIQVLQYLRQTGTLRVDPDAGSIGRAMDR